MPSLFDGRWTSLPSEWNDANSLTDSSLASASVEGFRRLKNNPIFQQLMYLPLIHESQDPDIDEDNTEEDSAEVSLSILVGDTNVLLQIEQANKVYSIRFEPGISQKCFLTNPISYASIVKSDKNCSDSSSSSSSSSSLAGSMGASGVLSWVDDKKGEDGFRLTLSPTNPSSSSSSSKGIEIGSIISHIYIQKYPRILTWKVELSGGSRPYYYHFYNMALKAVQ